jgi:hypothetical protein
MRRDDYWHVSNNKGPLYSTECHYVRCTVQYSTECHYVRCAWQTWQEMKEPQCNIRVWGNVHITIRAGRGAVCKCPVQSSMKIWWGQNCPAPHSNPGHGLSGSLLQRSIQYCTALTLHVLQNCPSQYVQYCSTLLHSHAGVYTTVLHST